MVDLPLAAGLGQVVGDGANDPAARIGGDELRDHVTQLGALLTSFDLAGDTDLGCERHVNQEAACKRDLRGDARPFCADGFFDDLNELGLTALQLFGDVGGRTAARPGRAPAPASRDGLSVSSSIAIPVPVFLVGVVSLTHTLFGVFVFVRLD